MKLSVLVPTWKRYDKLRNALESLVLQNRQADEVIAVYRDIDPDSLNIIQEFESKLSLVIVKVNKPGVVHAENSALLKVTGDIVCFLDDDAVAPRDWLALIEEFYQNHSEYAGFGGSDLIVLDEGIRQKREVVGQITWYGKIIGNHHQKVSKAQEVDVLKGVNMSFRKDFITNLDEKLGSEHHLGNGSHWELDLCFHVKKMGGRLYFDPSLEVKHDSNHSHFIKYENIKNNTRNLIYVMLKNLPIYKLIVFLIYITMIGNSQIFGLGRFLYELRRGPIIALKSYFASLQGILLGIKLL